jgi:hypothetical protein
MQEEERKGCSCLLMYVDCGVSALGAGRNETMTSFNTNEQ